MPPPLTPTSPAELTALRALHARISTLLSTTDPTSYNLPAHLHGPALHRAVYSMLACDAPDAAILRFLRANKFDVPAAFTQYLSHLRWRTCTMRVADIMASGEVGAAATEKDSSASKEAKADATGFLKQMRLGKSFVRGTDREGRPVVVIKVRLHRGGDQSVASLEKFGVWHIESTRLIFGEGVNSALLVFDMTGFGLTNMDYTPLKFIISTLTSYYPLGLADVVIHHAPWIFTACWRLIKGWIPAEFLSHIHFTKDVKDMEKLMNRDNILKEVGGDDPWVFKWEEPDVPGDGNAIGFPGKLSAEAEEEKERLWAERLEIAARFEAKTKEWVDAAEDGDEKKGEGDIAAIQADRDAISKELVLSYWRLDPLIRARSIYDRWGWIKSPLQQTSA